jgi:TonB family protein
LILRLDSWYIQFVMNRVLPFLLLLVVPLLSQGQDDTAEFRALIEKSAASTSLTTPGSQPFHFKLEAADSTKVRPEYKTEIEVWWAAPDKWRLELKSPMFSETAVQNGQRYSESTSGDYLPSWLHELMTVPLNPLPVEELATVEPELSGMADHRRAQWESPFSDGANTISIHNSILFDGVVPKEIFTRTVSATLSAYQRFGAKSVPRSFEFFDKQTTIRAYVVGLEQLDDHSDVLFAVAHDTGFNTRTRFVEVSQASLENYKLETPPMVWPVIHNFPDTGVIAVHITLDRAGAIREVGSPISKNVALTNPAAEQIRNWKFRPYLVDGAPVQVSTYISFPFKAKFELLGENSAALEAQPFVERIKRSRELSDLNLPGCKPFHLVASFQLGDAASGSSDLIWQEPTKWRRETKLGDVTVLESQLGDRVYRKVLGAPVSPKQIDDVIQELDGHLPDKRYSIYEGDWGHSAVKWSGVDVVRVARGQVDQQNNPVNGQAYWFAPNGLLLGAFEASRTSSYLSFADWNGKQVPRSIDVSEKGSVVLRLKITEIDDLPSQTDSAFVLEGVEPKVRSQAGQFDSSQVVPPKPLHKVAPKNPHAGHGTVIVIVQLDLHGHVTNAIIRESGGDALDKAAIEAAKQWEFTPMMVQGKVVPGAASIRFEF